MPVKLAEKSFEYSRSFDSKLFIKTHRYPCCRTFKASEVYVLFFCLFSVIDMPSAAIMASKDKEEIKLETAPFDPRFPNTNQSR